MLRGGSEALQGLALGASCMGLAIFFITYGKFGVEQRQVVESRRHQDDPNALQASDLDLNDARVPRYRLLHGLLYGALGMFAVALLFPIRSLGSRMTSAQSRTGWGRGVRVVRSDGSAVHKDDLEVGSMVTVFPQGEIDNANAQTVLIHLGSAAGELPNGRASWSAAGYVAFSKVCTHAGCPVGLYRSAAAQLLCPCHQSVFDVRAAAQPISGPAARALPQLPLEIAADGTLIAAGDFSDAIGPDRWNYL